MNAEVLIIEDVAEMTNLISLYLRKEGMSVHSASTGEAGWKIFQEKPFDLVILDLNLPGMDGFEFLKILRAKSEVPVMIVSARDQDEDLVLGLGLGADDFVVKPFSPRVLTARCRSLLKRKFLSADAVPAVHRFGNIEFLPDTRLLYVNGQKTPLSSREYDLLKFLLDHPGQPFRSEDLYEQVWGLEFGDISAVGVYLQRLRKKIEINPSEPRYLQTVRGFGYCFQP